QTVIEFVLAGRRVPDQPRLSPSPRKRGRAFKKSLRSDVRIERRRVTAVFGFHQRSHIYIDLVGGRVPPRLNNQRLLRHIGSTGRLLRLLLGLLKLGTQTLDLTFERVCVAGSASAASASLCSVVRGK